MSDVKKSISEHVSSGYDWIQKRSFTIIFFIGIGAIIGILGTNAFNERDMVRAINLGSFEFKGYLFNVEPSSKPKFFKEGGEKSITSMVIDKVKEQPPAPVMPLTEAVKEDPAKKGKK
jgi:hypothetical protein